MPFARRSGAVKSRARPLGAAVEGDEEEKAHEDAGEEIGAITSLRKPHHARGKSVNAAETECGMSMTAQDWRRANAEESTLEHQGRNDSLATAELEYDTPVHRDARAIREKALKRAATGKDRADDGMYKGQAGYIDWYAGFRREQTAASDYKASYGPQRAPSNVRRSYEVDYNPPICKDFKETGFCGYGDSCKFAHMREDYKSGWQLENDWEEQQKRKQKEQMQAADRAAKIVAGEAVDEEDAATTGYTANEQELEGSVSSGLPFACYICRKSFMEVRDPVVTRCKHYFCEECALRRFQSDRTCAACGAHTQGVFNAATDVLNEVKKRKRGEKASLPHAKSARASSGEHVQAGPRKGQQGWMLG